MKIHNAKTYRAAIVAWLQMVLGRIWHLPERTWNRIAFRWRKPMASDEFRERIRASTERIRKLEAERLRKLQLKADADAAELRSHDPKKGC